ncbi:unnamed protein product [Didymodactylos carnosus]|uniref:Uncharacterized protein n=1 Tax=Didymodactylos carnosus TaxID=1234261 RepID=A0A814W564_9BILA|nr:unnamed protein product [Didymodactylos carnosus]CAF3961219.1 unnamed protein product [Didymodactylos carnosus]
MQESLNPNSGKGAYCLIWNPGLLESLNAGMQESLNAGMQESLNAGMQESLNASNEKRVRSFSDAIDLHGKDGFVIIAPQKFFWESVLIN